MMQIINPATEELVTTIEADTADTVSSKYSLLRSGQPQWAALPLAQRIECISRFSALLDEHRDELALTLTSEMGKPLKEAHNELNGARARIQFFTDNAEKYLSEEWITESGATREKIVYEPLGVIGSISAWNYPYLVGVNVFVPALLSGNAVLYKPSEYAVLTGLRIAELLHAAGVPQNCFQPVAGGAAAGEAVLEQPLNGVFFTGSYKTGRYIAGRVAERLVPCGLELGGKDPLYVMDDVADIEAVAAAALEGVVYNNGQSCCAVERIYVHENVYDAFVSSYVSQCSRLVPGNPLDAATDVGPLSRREQLAFLETQVKDAVDKGAVLRCGGKIREGRGYFFEPGVLTGVNHSMRIMKEESFGPVVGIQKVKDDAEAVALMQDTEYGLTAAVYSADYARAAAVMQQMDTGTVYWNCCDRVSASLPWSGRKHSGLGSTLSYQGIRTFVQPKAYHLRG